MPPTRQPKRDRRPPPGCPYRPKIIKPDLGNRKKDLEAEAILNRLHRTSDAPLEADKYLDTLSAEAMMRANKHVFGKPETSGADREEDMLSDDSEVVNSKKKKKKKKKIKPTFDDMGVPRRDILRGLSHQMERKAFEAKVNVTRFEHFNFEKNIKGKRPTPPETIIDWNGEMSRSCLSQDGVRLVAHFPDCIGKRGMDSLNESINSFAERFPPRECQTKMSEGKPYIYGGNEGELTGETRLVRFWHWVGQNCQEDPVPSSDFLKGGGRFREHCDLLSNLYLVSHRVNEAIRFMDPKHYNDAKRLREAVEKRYPFARTLGALDPLLYEGHELLYNVMSGEHTDRFDPPGTYAIIAAAGNFKGGHLFFRHLGLRVRLEPGDIVMFRGRVLKHMVEVWTGGQRISIPHFTHSSVWKLMGMGDLVRCT